jgi:TATA-box binding protein (TBP) (component of TFIID and TFIIIB)
MTNLTLDIQKMFDTLEVVDYVVIPKRRGRKKKTTPDEPNKDLVNGSIITLEYGDKIRGVDLKKKSQQTKKKGNYFRNSVTVVMIIENKRLNFKISRNGKLQITGCKSDNQAEMCIKYIWELIRVHPEIYEIEGTTPHEKGNYLKAIFIPAMRNIDFPLGFLVNRANLDSYINNLDADYDSLLELSFGYTGVNIKIPVPNDINDLKLKQLEFITDTWSESLVPYETYLNSLKQKEREKKLNKERKNTFLVFHSGKVIMSGTVDVWMKDTYYIFLDLIRDCYEFIEERLD